MSNWKALPEMDEPAQARFLLDVAHKAMPELSHRPEHQAKIAQYLATAEAVLGGDVSRFAHLRRFLSDPQMTDDSDVYLYEMDGDDRAIAVLDLAAYACGFVARIMAPAAGNPSLPDSIVDADASIADYFERQAARLGL